MLSNKRRAPARRRTFVFGVGVLLVLFLSVAAGVASGSQRELRATSIEPAGQIETPKSVSGKLAQTDGTLLNLSGDKLVNVMVKLDYDAIASYRGTIKGLRATSPRVTGRSLASNARAVRPYSRYVARYEARALRAIRDQVSGARVLGRYRQAYGGVAMQVPANQIKKLLRVGGVAAVQRNVLAQPLTDATPRFLGATSVWPSLGGSNRAGQGVKVGVIDTGIWPEHPSYNDPGVSHPGGSYGCEFGDGSDPQLGASFTCNDKLIGAYAKTDTYMANIGSVAGENCNNATDECSARDADGHGTHTSSTAAGSPVSSATLFGINRGSVSGMAPGAHVIMYRVCLRLGCFGSDSVASVEQAIVDDVDVLNFSISGGASAYTDPVELAFLDAYAAGILVNASAGNAGPGAGTANHAGPWTNTVAASTSDRHFVGSVTITASNGDRFTMEGATITPGVSTPTPVVRGNEVPGQPDDLCRPSLEPGGVNFAPSSVAGKIVVCRREIGARALKSYNVNNGGGAGMILYNGPPNFGVNTDNHWVPSTHLENTTTGAHPLVAFLDSHTGEMATFTTGAPTTVPGDVMTAFSSRGPVGDFIKPDVTAPGIQILAGTSPDPFDTNFVVGPPGQFYQAIAGTSMSSPHSAGVAALVKAAHPSWTPGQIKSALMTSSLQDVMKQDGVTPSNPFDRGAGAIRANRAVNPTVTFDVPAVDYYASAANPLGRIHLNLPSVNAGTMSGEVTTERTFQNVSGRGVSFDVETTAPPGAEIEVRPRNPHAGNGKRETIRITISAPMLAGGQYFGEIRLDPRQRGLNDVVIPVAFFKRQGVITFDHTCSPTTFPRSASAACTVFAQNTAATAAATAIAVDASKGGLEYSNVTGPPGTQASKHHIGWQGMLSAALAPTVDSITPGGSPAGYLPLSGFGIAPIAMGDETIVNFNVPTFRFGDEPYTRIAASSNGYSVIGGGTAQDNLFEPQTFPNPARPNNVIAPYWTDLNMGVTGAAFRAATLGDGVNTWLVLDWENAPVFSNNAQRQSFQIWVQLGATESITWVYGPVTAASADPRNIGAENRDGTSGVNVAAAPAAGDDYTVNTSGPTPGGSVTIGYTASSRKAGVFDSVASLTSNVTVGTMLEVERLTVTR